MAQKLQNIQDPYIGYMGQDGGGLIIGFDGYVSDDFRGEVLFYSANQDDSIVVGQLNRVALFGPLPNAPDKGLSGVFSLLGPIRQSEIKSGPDGRSIVDLSLNIHYEALPLRRSSHIWVPEVEQMDGSLSWQQEIVDDNFVLWQNVRLTARLNPESRKYGAIEIFGLNLPKIIFRQTNDEKQRGEPHKSILSHCGPPDSNCENGTPVKECRLPIKFVNLTKNETLADVEDLCNQLINAVKTVWRDQVALDLTVWPNEEDYSNNPPPPLQGGQVDDNVLKNNRPSQVNLWTVQGVKQFQDSIRIEPVAWGHIEVYLVDNLVGAPYVSGGTTIYPKSAEAACVLQFNKASANPKLLAHELGHVLGLSDNPRPAEQSTLELGSPGSIMADSTSDVNTTNHCNFLHPSPNTNQNVNPIVKHTQVSDCCNPKA